MKLFSEKITGSRLVRNTGWLILGQGTRIVIQALYFVLMARALGVSGYGAFAGVAAWAAVTAPFSGIGYGNILIKNVARDRSRFAPCWGNALLMTVISGVLLTVVVIGFSVWTLPPTIPVVLTMLVALSDLVFTRLVDISAQAFQSVELLDRTARVQVMLNLFRLVAIVGLILYTSTPSIVAWGACYLASAVVSAGLAVGWVSNSLGKPVLSGRYPKREIKEGIYFSISLSAQNVYNDIDKTMLSRFSTLSATGIYGAAYRLIDISFLPVRSLLWASNVRFFQHGAEGLHSGIRYAKKLLPWASLYGVAIGVVLLVGAPLIPFVLGHGYQESVPATRWLAILPFIRVMHYFASDALTGADHQGVRSGIQVSVALLNVILNFWLIPAYSWLGAAWSSCITDGLLAISMWIAVASLLRKESRQRFQSVSSDEISLKD